LLLEMFGPNLNKPDCCRNSHSSHTIYSVIISKREGNRKTNVKINQKWRFGLGSSG